MRLPTAVRSLKIGKYVPVRVSKIVADHDDILTQSRYTYMSKLRENNLC